LAPGAEKLCIGLRLKPEKDFVSGRLATGTARAYHGEDPEGIENDAETGATKKTPEKGAINSRRAGFLPRVLTETHSAWRLFFPPPL
jgi:hypothetical protein